MRRAAGIILFSALLVSGASSASAQCGTPVGGVSKLSSVTFVPRNTDIFALGRALDIWGEGCGGMGSAYPALVSASQFDHSVGNANFNVFFSTGTSPNGRCGTAVVNYSASDGQLTGGDITIYEYQVVDGQQQSCEPNRDAIIAHEIGHALGLADNYLMNPGACVGTIMSERPSYIGSEECAAVKDNFDTHQEQVADCEKDCAGNCGGTPVTCTATPTCQSCTGSPVIVDLDGNGFHLTALDAGVLFDIDNDGHRDRMAWSRADQLDAFLSLDRDGDGKITSGAELFGNYTPLSGGRTATNGYEALLEFDGASGNPNGLIDGADKVWPALRLWVDQNHNGISEPEELTTLDQRGIHAIDLQYFAAERRDPFGNLFRFRSRILRTNPEARLRSNVTYDVFFVVAPQ